MNRLIVLASIAFVMTKTLLVRVRTLIPYAALREVIKLA